MRGSARLLKVLLFCGVAAAAVALAGPQPAEAHGSVHVGIGFGIPLAPAYYPSPAYYPAYPAPAYYPPPAVAYAPPPAYVESPPPPEQQCREYTATSVIGGRPQQVVGTACLQADGTWRIIR